MARKKLRRDKDVFGVRVSFAAISSQFHIAHTYDSRKTLELSYEGCHTFTNVRSKNDFISPPPLLSDFFFITEISQSKW